MSNKTQIRIPKTVDSQPVDRRGFLKFLVATTAGVLGTGSVREAEAIGFEKFLQKHFTELKGEKLQKVLDRIEREARERFGDPSISVGAEPAIPGVRYGYALNLSRCIGCRRCVEACVEENNLSREPEIEYIRVLEMPLGTTDIEHGDHYYDAEEVPRDGYYYMPIQCHHCSNPPCVKVCPVEATWQEPDGIVVIDYDWCIGCRYCQAACPYWARRFNFSEPSMPAEDVNPNMHYLGNRPRAKGVMEKCTFCIQRVRKGLMPACHDACPTGARKFGNMADPNSEVRQVLANKRIFILKEEAGTHPNFFYFFE
jgi:Fe-S-cluster-containing dehydrogenase component